MFQWEWLPRGLREITADHAAQFDALYVNSPRVPAAAVARSDLRLKLISRHGVGYDSVDVPAMTKAGVLVANTPNAVPRPVATIALTFVLALAHRLMAKDRITRAGHWPERLDHMGMGLTGRTLGVVGAGRIGKELLRMAKTFDLKLLAADPYAERLELEYIGARPVPLAELMAQSDFVVDHLPAERGDPRPGRRPRARADEADARTSSTWRAARWWTKRRCTKRSPRGASRGAGLDVFEQEPTPADNPILKLDNVIVSPHALCWTDELFGNIARTAIGAIVAVHAGRRPEFVVNPAALAHPRAKVWLKA